MLLLFLHFCATLKLLISIFVYFCPIAWQAWIGCYQPLDGVKASFSTVFYSIWSVFDGPCASSYMAHRAMTISDASDQWDWLAPRELPAVSEHDLYRLVLCFVGFVNVACRARVHLVHVDWLHLVTHAECSCGVTVSAAIVFVCFPRRCLKNGINRCS